jgi:hypothetical protein
MNGFKLCDSMAGEEHEAMYVLRRMTRQGIRVYSRLLVSCGLQVDQCSEAKAYGMPQPHAHYVGCEIGGVRGCRFERHCALLLAQHVALQLLSPAAAFLTAAAAPSSGYSPLFDLPGHL